MAWDSSTRRRPRNGPHSSLRSVPLAMLLVGAAGVGYTSSDLSIDRITSALPGSGCNIKGNISINTGERIYHVPGQKYYDNTIISPRYGERWFCSEADARRAGWRKSHQ